MIAITGVGPVHDLSLPQVLRRPCFRTYSRRLFDPQGVLAPVPAAAPGTGQVDMLVATTRSPTESSEMFSGARANSRPVFAGSCFVGITPICKRTLAMNVTPCDWEKP
jgi:hypothetical protein